MIQSRKRRITDDLNDDRDVLKIWYCGKTDIGAKQERAVTQGLKSWFSLLNFYTFPGETESATSFKRNIQLNLAVSTHSYGSYD